MIYMKYIEECNPNKKWKILIRFDDVIADILSNKKLNPVETELLKVENLMFLLFLLHKLILLYQNLNSTQCFILRIYNKQELQQITVINQILILKLNESLKKVNCKTIFFLVIDNTLASDNDLPFRKNLLERV